MKKRIPKVIRWTPNFIMKWIGKRHGAQGKELCEAHLNAWMNKGAVVYDKEIKNATEITNETETNVINALHQIIKMRADAESLTNEDIKLRRKAQINVLSSRVRANMDMIGATDRVLEARLREVMDTLNYKLDFYKAGAITSLKDYDKEANDSDLFQSFNLIESHKGYVNYRKNRKDLEKRISEVVGVVFNTQKNNDVEQEVRNETVQE